MNEGVKIALPGKSGKKYLFDVYQYGYGWTTRPGVYLISRAAPDRAGKISHTILFVGEADELRRDLLANIIKFRFIEYGPTHLLWLEEESIVTRFQIVQDLIDHWDPLLNKT